MTVHWLPREEWDNSGRPRLGHQVPHEQFVGTVMHHDVSLYLAGAGEWRNYTRTERREQIIDHARWLRTVRAADLGEDWPYSFGIGMHYDPNDAWLVEGRGLGRTGAHTAGYNSSRYGIVLFGDWRGWRMTPGMVEAFRLVGSWLADPINAVPTLAHSQVASTACPGDARHDLPKVQPPFTPEDDMSLTPEQDEMLKAVYSAIIDQFPNEDHPLRAHNIAYPVLWSNGALRRQEGKFAQVLGGLAELRKAIEQVDSDDERLDVIVGMLEGVEASLAEVQSTISGGTLSEAERWQIIRDLADEKLREAAG